MIILHTALCSYMYKYAEPKQKSCCINIYMYLGGNTWQEQTKDVYLLEWGYCTCHTWGYFVRVCVCVWKSDTVRLHHTAAIGHHCDLYQCAISLLYRTLLIISSLTPSFSFPVLSFISSPLVSFPLFVLCFSLTLPGDIKVPNRGGCSTTLCSSEAFGISF